VSSALLRVGGQGIQDECRQKYPSGIQVGQIAVTGPGRTSKDVEEDGQQRLDCKRIFHCCLPSDVYDPSKMDSAVVKEVRSFIFKT
jgi:O-acetyl-ADP-ribose deacetylase (regulator of RNase III)